MRKFEMKLEELKITNMTTYEPEEGEEKFHKLLLERQQKIEDYAKEKGIELKKDDKADSADATDDTKSDDASDQVTGSDQQVNAESSTDDSSPSQDDAKADS